MVIVLISERVCVCVCMYVYIYIYIYICVCVCVYSIILQAYMHAFNKLGLSSGVQKG